MGSIFTDENQPLTMDGRRAVRIFALMFMLLGVVFFAGGVGFSALGEMGRARYEKSTGKLIRMVSREDNSNYRALKSAVTLGRTAQGMGIFLGGIGALLLWRPHLFFLILRYSIQMTTSAATPPTQSNRSE